MEVSTWTAFSRIVLIFFSFLGLLSCDSRKKDAAVHYEKALKFKSSNNLAEASNEIDSALSLDTTQNEYFYLKAKIKTNGRFYKESNNILESLLKKKYKIDSINYLIGENYYALGNYYRDVMVDSTLKNESYINAVDFYDKTIQNNSKYISAYIHKSSVLYNNGNYNESLLVINDALNIFPDNEKLILIRGVDKYGLDDYSGAFADFNNAIKSRKLDSAGYAIAFKFSGIVFQLKDSLEMALLNINTAIQYTPKDAELYEVRGDIYKGLSKKDLACESYRKAGDLGAVTVYKIIKEYCK